MNKAAAQKTMSKAGEFVWDQKDNQTFAGPGQTATQPPQVFNKWAGHYFSMEAPGQTLTLEVSDGSYNFWSMAGQETPPPTSSTDIGVKKGNFVFKSNGTLQLGFEIPSTPTRLTVDNDARFTIGGTLKLIALQGVSINANKESVFDINCGQIDFSEAGAGARSVFITATDTARISMAASSTFNMSKASVTVSSSSGADPDEYALKLLSTDDPGSLTLTGSSVTFNIKARGLLRSQALALDNTTIQANGDAACALQFNAVSPTNGAKFALNNRATMKFDSFSGGSHSPPFNFFLNTYQPGLFAFADASSASGAAFVIRALAKEAEDRILTQGLVSVGGENQYDAKKLSFTYDAGYLTIKINK
jgi:hypothetical protein